MNTYELYLSFLFHLEFLATYWLAWLPNANWPRSPNSSFLASFPLKERNNRMKGWAFKQRRDIPQNMLEVSTKINSKTAKLYTFKTKNNEKFWRSRNGLHWSEQITLTCSSSVLSQRNMALTALKDPFVVIGQMDWVWFLLVPEMTKLTLLMLLPALQPPSWNAALFSGPLSSISPLLSVLFHTWSPSEPSPITLPIQTPLPRKFQCACCLNAICGDTCWHLKGTVLYCSRFQSSIKASLSQRHRKVISKKHFSLTSCSLHSTQACWGFLSFLVPYQLSVNIYFSVSWCFWFLPLQA